VEKLEHEFGNYLKEEGMQGHECIFSMFLHRYFIKLSLSSSRIFVFYRAIVSFNACLHKILK
jgi:hypothetical protein